MTNASRRQHGFGIVGALDQEWGELVGMHPGAVMGWAVRHPALAPYRSLDDVLVAAKQSPMLSSPHSLLRSQRGTGSPAELCCRRWSAGSHGWRNAIHGPALMTTWRRSGR